VSGYKYFEFGVFYGFLSIEAIKPQTCGVALMLDAPYSNYQEIRAR
jgi:hypothetical protein